VFILLDQFIAYLEHEDKYHALQLCLDALEAKTIDVAGLYEKVLTPALNRIDDVAGDESDLIWREHVWSAIIRSVIESVYPYVMRERQAKNLVSDEAVVIFCPQEEDHDLGARMAADFFLIWGYKVTFIGANTPEKTILRAVERIQPHYLCISVSNYFNLVVTRKLVDHLRSLYGRKMQILVGGHAVASRPTGLQDVGADRLLRTFADIGQLRLASNGDGV
jgi:methanogenic corrinoid protein MtbC1